MRHRELLDEHAGRVAYLRKLGRMIHYRARVADPAQRARFDQETARVRDELAGLGVTGSDPFDWRGRNRSR